MPHAGLSGGLEHFLCVGQSVGQRFFAQHVLSGLDSFDHHGLVEESGRGHAHEVDVIALHQLLPVRLDAFPSEFVREPSQVFLRILGAHSRHLDDAGKVIEAPRVPESVGMGCAHELVADQTDPDDRFGAVGFPFDGCHAESPYIGWDFFDLPFIRRRRA
jgi:hypothetical protein